MAAELESFALVLRGAYLVWCHVGLPWFLSATRDFRGLMLERTFLIQCHKGLSWWRHSKAGHGQCPLLRVAKLVLCHVGLSWFSATRDFLGSMLQGTFMPQGTFLVWRHKGLSCLKGLSRYCAARDFLRDRLAHGQWEERRNKCYTATSWLTSSSVCEWVSDVKVYAVVQSSCSGPLRTQGVDRTPGPSASRPAAVGPCEHRAGTKSEQFKPRNRSLPPLDQIRSIG